jgi:hypothetical protein
LLLETLTKASEKDDIIGALLKADMEKNPAYKALSKALTKASEEDPIRDALAKANIK